MGEDIRFRFTSSGAMEVRTSIKSIANAGEELVKRLAALDEAQRHAKTTAAQLAAAEKQVALSMRQAAAEAAKAQNALKTQRAQTGAEAAALQKKHLSERQDAWRQGQAEARNRRRRRDEEKTENAIRRERTKTANTELANQRRAERAQASRRAKFYRGVGAVGRATATGAGLAVTGVIGAGLGLVGGAVREVMDLQKQAAQTAVLGRRGGMKFGAGFGPGVTISPEALMARYQTEAIRTGLSSQDIAAGVHRYAAVAGDVQSAVQMMSTMSTAAVATGTSMEDMAKAMEGLQRVFGIKGIQESQQALATWIGQAKEGGMEMRDMAQFVAELGSGFAALGGENRGQRGAKMLGMITQQAYMATGNPREAITAVRNILATLTGKTGQLKEKYGIDVFETVKGGGKRGRRIEDILADYIVKAGGKGGDIEKRAEAMTLFPIRGRKFFMPFLQAVNDAESAVLKKAQTEGWATNQTKLDTEKQKAAYGAIHDVMKKFIDAGGDWAEVMADFATVTETPATKLDQAWESVKQQVAVALLPAITDIVNKLPELLPAVDLFIGVLGAVVDTLAEFIEAIDPEGAAKLKRGAAKTRADWAEAALESYKSTLPATGRTPAQDKRLAELQAKNAEMQAALNKALGPQPAKKGGFLAYAAGEQTMGGAMANAVKVWKRSVTNPLEATNALLGAGEYALNYATDPHYEGLGAISARKKAPPPKVGFAPWTPTVETLTPGPTTTPMPGGGPLQTWGVEDLNTKAKGAAGGAKALDDQARLAASGLQLIIDTAPKAASVLGKPPLVIY